MMSVILTKKNATQKWWILSIIKKNITQDGWVLSYQRKMQLLWLISQRCNIEKEQGSDDMISCAKVVSVSALYSRCSNFMFSSCSITCFSHRLHIDFLWLVYIYSIDTILYPYALPLESIPILISSLCLSTTWALWVKIVTATWIWVEHYLC